MAKHLLILCAGGVVMYGALCAVILDATVQLAVQLTLMFLGICMIAWSLGALSTKILKTQKATKI